MHERRRCERNTGRYRGARRKSARDKMAAEDSLIRSPAQFSELLLFEEEALLAKRGKSAERVIFQLARFHQCALYCASIALRHARHVQFSFSTSSSWFSELQTKGSLDTSQLCKSVFNGILLNMLFTKKLYEIGYLDLLIKLAGSIQVGLPKTISSHWNAPPALGLTWWEAILCHIYMPK